MFRTISMMIAVLAWTLTGASAGSFVTIAPPKPGHTPSIIVLGDKPPLAAEASSDAPVGQRQTIPQKAPGKPSPKLLKKIAKSKAPLTKLALAKALGKKADKSKKPINTAAADKSLGKKALKADKPIRTASAGKSPGKKLPAATKAPAKSLGKAAVKAIVKVRDPAKPRPVQIARAEAGDGTMKKLSRSIIAFGTPKPGVTDERVAAIGRRAPAPMLIRGGIFGDQNESAAAPAPDVKSSAKSANAGAPEGPFGKAGVAAGASKTPSQTTAKPAPEPAPEATTTLR